MEERARARGVTQHRFEVEPVPPPNASAEVPVTPDPAPDPPSPASDAPRSGPPESSSVRLRERQGQWLEERARFEAHERRRKERSDAP